MARSALLRLPGGFKLHLDRLVLQVDDFAESALLAELGIDDPFALTGVYEGVALTEQSIEHTGQFPPRIRLFRLPILLEWCERSEESLERLVAHVTIHEVGHHFGLSDADMHALEEQAC